MRPLLHLIGTLAVGVGTLVLPWYIDAELLIGGECCLVADVMVNEQAENASGLLGLLGLSGAVLGLGGASLLVPRLRGLLLAAVGIGLALYGLFLVDGLRSDPFATLGSPPYVGGGQAGPGGPLTIAGGVVWALVGLSLLAAPAGD